MPMAQSPLGIFVGLFIVSIVLVCSDASSSKTPMKLSGGVSCFGDNFLGHNLRPCGIIKRMGFLTSGHH